MKRRFQRQVVYWCLDVARCRRHVAFCLVSRHFLLRHRRRLHWVAALALQVRPPCCSASSRTPTRSYNTGLSCSENENETTEKYHSVHSIPRYLRTVNIPKHKGNTYPIPCCTISGSICTASQKPALLLVHSTWLPIPFAIEHYTCVAIPFMMVLSFVHGEGFTTTTHV